MAYRWRGAGLVALKSALAVALIAWLVRSGALDWRALRTITARPSVMIAQAAVFAIVVVLGAVRWRLLLHLVGVQIGVARAVQLHSAGIFFNVVVPGSVGGDVVKILYAEKSSGVAPAKRASLLLVALIDRMVGLVGLVAIAWALSAWQRSSLLATNTASGHATAKPLPLLFASTSALGFAVLAALAVAWMLTRYARSRLALWSTSPSRLLQHVAKGSRALQLLLSDPRVLVQAFGSAVLMHFANILFFTMLSRAVAGVEVTLVESAVVFPLGLLTTMVPLSPGGIGVGHMAFDRLFHAVGVAGGATIYNVYLVGQIALSLTGALPYLALRRHVPVSQSEAAVG